MPALFKHDCDACTFLGNVDGLDHYVCPDSGSLIARHGNNGEEYTSVNRRYVSAILAVDPAYVLGVTAALAARRGL